jgi:TRAP-type mannitol/chloroaromatic compound transport system permease small subunit
MRALGPAPGSISFRDNDKSQVRSCAASAPCYRRGMFRLISIIDRFSDNVGVAAATLVIPLGLIMTYEALARFTLNLPTFWAYELSYMITGAHFALGIAMVTRRSEHIRIDFLYARMSVRGKAILDFCILLCFMAPVVSWVSLEMIQFAWGSWIGEERSGESGWNPVVWPVRVVIAFGFVTFALQLVAETVKTGATAFGFKIPEEGR